MKNKVNKQKRIIWTNDDYAEWCEAMAEEITEEEITPEYYGFCCETNLEDERMNLNIEVDGCIVVFASLGLWNGIRKGKAIVGTNVKDILSSNCDYVTWYCDQYNVRCDATHHDGTNHYIYRVAPNREAALRLINKDNFDEEKFRRATKSLRPYVAKVYGW